MGMPKHNITREKGKKKKTVIAMSAAFMCLSDIDLCLQRQIYFFYKNILVQY